ncbi:MAG TPA: DNA alkylation repair protein [Candidatus Hydrogenedentes bacterium]|nr:DNA alkylation repair protein [Candidatus Hydrogenedentota bacterium]
MDARDIRSDLKHAANAGIARGLARFFKTGEGEYGEGDQFLGVITSEQRRIAKAYLAHKTPPSVDRTLSVVQMLFRGGYHEERSTALMILVHQYRRSDAEDKHRIFNFYIKNLRYVNNWDLVDSSAPQIVGDYLLDKDPAILFELAKREDVWARRVAVLATFVFVKTGRFGETLALAEFLLIERKDRHDLMHKAVGWMLREIGKRDESVLIAFLDRFAAQLPRTALRYAIEKLDQKKRREYLRLGRPSNVSWMAR